MGEEIFANNGLENSIIKYWMENMILFLTKAYDPTYALFDKGKKNQQNFFCAFIKVTSQTFSVLAGDVDRTSSIPSA